MPFIPDNVEIMIQEYKRMAASSGLTLLLPAMNLIPETENPYSKADFYIQAFCKLKQGLAGSNIKLGILIQAMIGHGWTSAIPCNKFQHTINHDGMDSGRFCPLDENFLKYCRYVISGLAKHEPELFLLDDDTRLLNNDKIECFCPLHMAKLKHRYSQQDLINAVKNAKSSDPIFHEFEQVRRQSLIDYCHNIRTAIDSVNPGIPCGVCTPWKEYLNIEKMALAAAGPNHEPFVRLVNGMYFEGSAKELPRKLYQIEFYKKSCPNIKTFISEADTFPQTQYSKSAISMHALISCYILHGLNGSKVWISNFANPLKYNHAYEKSYHDNMNFYEELKKTTANIKWLGPAIPLPDLEKNFSLTKVPGYFNCAEFHSDIFGRLGIPCSFASAADTDAESFAISGELAEHLDSKDIEILKTKKLFLDNKAAQKFGYTTDKKCSRFATELDSLNKNRMRLLYNPEMRLLKKGGIPLSQLQQIVFTGSPMSDYAPGCVDYGKIIAWMGNVENLYSLTAERREFFLRTLRRICSIPLACANAQDVYCRCGMLDKNTFLFAIVNLNFDIMENILLDSTGTIENIQQLDSDGKWQNIEFCRQADIITVKRSAHIYEPVILKVAVK